MTVGERMHLAVRGTIFTIVTPWSRSTNTLEFILSAYEDAFLKLKVSKEIPQEDGRIIIYTEDSQ